MCYIFKHKPSQQLLADLYMCSCNNNENSNNPNKLLNHKHGWTENYGHTTAGTSMSCN